MNYYEERLRNSLEALESIGFKQLTNENLIQIIKTRGKIEGIELALSYLKD